MVRTKNAAPAQPEEQQRQPRVALRRLIRLPWPFRDDDHARRFAVITRRPIGDTRYIHSTTLDRLQISGRVYEYLDRLSWRRCASLRLPAYRELTYEFLSSFSYILDPHDPNDAGIITFRLMGVDRRITLAEFDAIFGFDSEGIREEHDDFNVEDHWELLTGKQYTPITTNVKYIHDHALRYIHRVMTHTVFGRGTNNSRLSRQEIFFLWCIHTHTRVDTGVWLLAQFKRFTIATRGSFVGMGLITQIACYFGFHPTRFPFVPTSSPEYVDLRLCRQMYLCAVGDRGEYHLLTTDGQLLPRQADVPDAAPEAAVPPPDVPVAEERPVVEDDVIPPFTYPPPPYSRYEHGSGSASAPPPSTEPADMTSVLHQFQSYVDSRLQQFEERVTQRLDSLDRTVSASTEQMSVFRQYFDSHPPPGP